MSRFTIYEDNAGEYRWRFQASNYRIISVSSEGYTNKSDCEASIGLMKRDAPSAPVEDETRSASYRRY
ncbi:MAG: DUF1508 domain-containing protein [Planctomycetota bacterium]